MLVLDPALLYGVKYSCWVRRLGRMCFAGVWPTAVVLCGVPVLGMCGGRVCRLEIRKTW